MFVFVICPPTPRTHQNRQLPTNQSAIALLKLYIYTSNPSYYSFPSRIFVFPTFTGTMPSARAGFSESAKEHGLGESESSSSRSRGMASESQVSRPGNGGLKSKAEMHV